MLDIGDDFGALVLYTSADLVGAEIEISPDADPDRRRHVAVHPRHYPGGTASQPCTTASLPALTTCGGADGSRCFDGFGRRQRRSPKRCGRRGFWHRGSSRLLAEGLRESGD